MLAQIRSLPHCIRGTMRSLDNRMHSSAVLIPWSIQKPKKEGDASLALFGSTVNPLLSAIVELRSRQRRCSPEEVSQFKQSQRRAHQCEYALRGYFIAYIDRNDRTMAGKHPIHIHPVRPLYRFAATGLGASMWFFVRIPHRLIRRI